MVVALQENGSSWIHVSDLQKEHTVAKAYAIKGVPQNFLIQHPIGIAQAFSIPSPYLLRTISRGTPENTGFLGANPEQVPNKMTTGHSWNNFSRVLIAHYCLRSPLLSFTPAYGCSLLCDGKPVHIVVCLHGQSAQRAA